MKFAVEALDERYAALHASKWPVLWASQLTHWMHFIREARGLRDSALHRAGGLIQRRTSPGGRSSASRRSAA